MAAVVRELVSARSVEFVDQLPFVAGKQNEDFPFNQIFWQLS